MMLPPSRLSLALDEGMILPAEGRIVVYRPRAGYGLSALPRDRLSIVQGFRPDYEAFEHAGYDVDVGFDGSAAMAVVVVPRAKALAQHLVAQAALAVGPHGLIVVDGQKGDGVDSLWKALRKRADVLGTASKSHGRVFWLTGADVADWLQAPSRTEDGYMTAPGVFSADGVDKGSALLAQALPAKLSQKVCDLGAGWGYLSQAILARDKVEHVDLVEAEHAAIEAAKVNVTDPRAKFHWSDALQFAGRDYGTVVMNPPFHTIRKADVDLGRAFIGQAAKILSARGELWMVANRHLGYEATLAETFRDVEEITGTPAFKVLRAARPLGNARPRA